KQELGARGDGGGQALGGELEVGVSIDVDGGCAGQRDQVAVHDEVGVGQEDLVAGADGGHERQQQAARDAGGDQDRRVAGRQGRSEGGGELGGEAGGDLAAQLGDALGLRITVEPVTDCVGGGVLDGLGHVEVRLADGEVHRVLEPSCQVEDAADPRGVDG